MTTTLGSRRKKRSFPLLRSISLALMAAAVGLLIIELVLFVEREEFLPAGISVAGVPVGNLPEADARTIVEEAYSQPVTLYYGESAINLSPDSVGFRISNDAMFPQASNAGQEDLWLRFGQYLLGEEDRDIRDIDLQASYQETALEDFLLDLSRRYDNTTGTAGYDVSSLTTFAGTSNFRLNINESLPLIDEALRRATNRVVELSVIGGETAVPDIQTLEDLIIAYFNSIGFIYDGQNSVASIYVMDLTTGEEINIQGDVAYSAASTTKVPILIEYFRNKNEPPTQDEAFIMANSLLCSANSSSNLLIQDFIGGGDMRTGLLNVTSTAQSLGANSTFLTSQYGEGVANQQFVFTAKPDSDANINFNTEPDPLNQTSAEDMGQLFTMIHDCANYNSGLMVAYPDEFNAQECRQMIELMSGLELKRLLEAGTAPGTRISHKNGWTGGMVGNAGIVYPPNGNNYIIAVFMWEQTDATSFRLWPYVEEVSRAVWNHFNPDNAMLSIRPDTPDFAQECFRTDEAGNIQNVYLPPYEDVNLDDIDAWRGN
ncbi:MAG: serine hydrolase [Aggregatilineales bacterium]